MISIARKNLFAEKTRFAVSITGVAFAILLMIFLMGIYSATNTLVTAYIEKMDIDILIAQEGVRNMTRSFSQLSKNKISQVERITGGSAYGLVSVGTNAILTEDDGSPIVDYPGRQSENNNGIKKELNIIGFDTESKVGGPLVNVKGELIPRKNQIIIDEVFARQNNLEIGDNIEAFDNIFTIAGITRENNMLVFTRGFVEIDKLQEILKQKEIVNFILVKLPDPSLTSSMIEKLKKELPGTSVYSRSEFAKTNGESITSSFLPIIFVITVLGFLTGAAIIGLLVYTSTLERLREFGILKAIGASNGFLFWVVFEQALVSSLAGFLVGVTAAFGLKEVVTYLVPAIPVAITPQILAIALISSLVMSLIASYIPVRRITKLDPAMVFRQ